MTTLHDTSAANRFLLWTLVRTALADGEVVPVELAMIENIMRALDLEPSDRQQVREVLQGRRDFPKPTAAVSLPKYEHRLIIFKDALNLAFADGVMEREEHEALSRLYTSLQIEPEDRDRLWQAARRKHTLGT